MNRSSKLLIHGTDSPSIHACCVCAVLNENENDQACVCVILKKHSLPRGAPKPVEAGRAALAGGTAEPVHVGKKKKT